MRFIFLMVLSAAISQSAQARYRISLLTCGVGEELYASFGHAGLRVIDSVTGTDVVYNYGTFNGFEEDFEIKFMRGKLLYYLAQEAYADFLPTYVEEGRSVWEQKLNLDSFQQGAVLAFLDRNLLPENRAYKYDFLYDNCATRLADILPATLNGRYKPGEVLPTGSKVTFRNTINQYLASKHWERYGIDLLLGNAIDKRMTDQTALYLPDYLRQSVRNATIGNTPAADAPEQILPAINTIRRPGANGPLLLNMGIMVFVFLCWTVPGLGRSGEVASRVLLFIAGLLGCLIAFMWLGTDHEACRNNFNILWANPLSVVAVWFPARKLRGICVFGTALILISLMLNVIGMQELPLFELWPILVAILWSYGMIYRMGSTRI